MFTSAEQYNFQTEAGRRLSLRLIREHKGSHWVTYPQLRIDRIFTPSPDSVLY